MWTTLLATVVICRCIFIQNFLQDQIFIGSKKEKIFDTGGHTMVTLETFLLVIKQICFLKILCAYFMAKLEQRKKL